MYDLRLKTDDRETYEITNVLSIYTPKVLHKKEKKKTKKTGIPFSSTHTKTEHYKDEQNLAREWYL